MIDHIYAWLIRMRLWLYMKPFCFDNSVDQNKKRYTSVGLNFPRGWKFFHIYFTTERNNINLRVLKTRSVRE